MPRLDQLSRRERQIMEILFRLEEASAKQVLENLPDAPGYSSVRTHLKKLVDKGYLELKESGLKYLYSPKVKRSVASRSALNNVVKTFFGDSPALAVNQLLNTDSEDISRDELEELEALIRQKLEKKKE